MNNKKRFKADILGQLRKKQVLEYAKDEYGGVAYQVGMVLGINKNEWLRLVGILGKARGFPDL